MQDFIIANKIPFTNGTLDINPSVYSRIFLDVGLSSDAHHSENWLRTNFGAIVFGFEPVPANVQAILKGAGRHHTILNPTRISRSFFLIPSALGEPTSGNTTPFYLTTHDLGCSSLLPPKRFELLDVIDVPIFRLSDFLDLIPWHIYDHIDFIKIDAQGKDLEIVKSGDKKISKVFAICLELDSDSYIGSNNTLFNALQYFLRNGFFPLSIGKKWKKINYILKVFFYLLTRGIPSEYLIDTIDPCFVNLKLLKSQRVRSLKITVD